MLNNKIWIAGMIKATRLASYFFAMTDLSNIVFTADL